MSTSKGNNVKETLLRQTSEEDNECLFSFFNSTSFHRHTSINQENILSFDFRNVEILFFVFFNILLGIINTHLTKFRHKGYNRLSVVVRLTDQHRRLFKLFKSIAKRKVFIWLHFFLSHLNFPNTISNKLRVWIDLMSF